MCRKRTEKSKCRGYWKTLRQCHLINWEGHIEIKWHRYFLNRARRTSLLFSSSFELFQMFPFYLILFLFKDFPFFSELLDNHFCCWWAYSKLLSSQHAGHRVLTDHLYEFPSDFIGNFVVLNGLISLFHYLIYYIRITSSWIWTTNCLFQVLKSELFQPFPLLFWGSMIWMQKSFKNIFHKLILNDIFSFLGQREHGT